MIARRVRCPQCGTMTEYRTDNPSRPFCSERCKLIDLGAWAEERYSIPGRAALADSNELFENQDGDNPTDGVSAPPPSNRRFQS
ncbi:MAG: DNA gyrase inhibitor YacG [Betaproteobacteria bacterium]